jgi:hypothetical protein
VDQLGEGKEEWRIKMGKREDGGGIEWGEVKISRG